MQNDDFANYAFFIEINMFFSHLIFMYFIVLLNAGFTKRRAYFYNLISSLMAVIGGVVGYYTLGNGIDLIPYVLVLASSGFIYIAVSDLMPQMQRRATWRDTVPQVILIALGVGLVLLFTHHVPIN